MKVTSTKEENFNPFTVSITFESMEEVKAVLAIALTNDSVPYAAVKHWGSLSTDQVKMKSFLKDLKREIKTNSGLTHGV